MARVFITGSADGLGLMAGELLASQGHSVVLHARNEVRARDARAALPQAEAVVVGDLSTIAAMRTVAAQANSVGRFDAVIHNVGIGYREPRRVTTEDGLSQLWAVNVLAPYVLTALMERAARLVYLSSGMHMGGDASLEDLQWEHRRGMARRPMPTPSFITCCSPSAWRGAGRTFCAMRSSQAGCRRGWAVQVRLMIFPRPMSPRLGWRRATIRPRR